MRVHLAGTSAQMAMYGGYGVILAMACVFALHTIDRAFSRHEVGVVAQNAIKPSPVQIKGKVLHLTGQIDYMANAALTAALKEHPDTQKIVLNSDGGLVFAARAMAATIIAHNLNTQASEACRSACVIAFLAGKNRRIIGDAVIGVHGYEMTQDHPDMDVTAQMQMDLEFYVARGVSREFAQAAFAVVHGDMWEPSHAELRAAGVLSP